MAIVDSKMELTFSLRRKEIVDEESLVANVLKQWPALFLEDQVSLSILDYLFIYLNINYLV